MQRFLLNILFLFGSCSGQNVISSQLYRKRGLIQTKWSVYANASKDIPAKDRTVNCGILCSLKPGCNSFRVVGSGCHFGYVRYKIFDFKIKSFSQIDCFVNLIGLSDSSAVEVYAENEIEECKCYSINDIAVAGPANRYGALLFGGWKTEAELQTMDGPDDYQEALHDWVGQYRLVDGYYYPKEKE